MIYDDFLWDIITDQIEEPVTAIEILEAIEADMPIFIDKIGPIADTILEELVCWVGDYAEDPDSFEDISIHDFYDNVGNPESVDAFFGLAMQRYLS